LTIVLDVFGRRGWARLLIDNGQNPMIAYVGHTNLVLPIMAWTTLGAHIDAVMNSLWRGVITGVFLTLLVALATSLFTRRKIFLRA